MRYNVVLNQAREGPSQPKSSVSFLIYDHILTRPPCRLQHLGSDV